VHRSDNHDAATTLAETLRLQGYQVRVAFDSIDGLRQARDFVPHVAFLDLNMPGMDGIELGRKMREDVRTRAATLVALTGMSQPADGARTREAGFNAHLRKPANPEEIGRLAAGDEAVELHIAGVGVRGPSKP